MEALLITADNTAKLLGISPRTLWTLTKENAISVIRIGRRVLYAMADIQLFIDAQRNNNKQQPIAMGIMQ